MSDARRERLREALVERYVSARQRKGPVALTPDKLAAIAALPDVVEVRTFRNADGRVDGRGRGEAGGRLHRQRPARGPRTPADRRAGSRPMARRKSSSRNWRSTTSAGATTRDLEQVARHSRCGSTVGGVRNAPPLALARALMGRLPGDELTAAQSGGAGETRGRACRSRLDSFDLTPAERAELKRLLEAKHDSDDERPLESAATFPTPIRCAVSCGLSPSEEKKKRTPLESWELMRGDVFLSPDDGRGTASADCRGGETRRCISADVRVRPGGDLPGTVAAIEAHGLPHASPGRSGSPVRSARSRSSRPG